MERRLDSMENVTEFLKQEKDDIAIMTSPNKPYKNDLITPTKGGSLDDS